MPDIRVRLGRRLRLLRVERAMSQEEMCARAGITQAYLSRIENGRAEPKLAVLAALAHALRIKLCDLVDGVD